ncbi:MAG: B12-binding domain-containing radical SAM protein [Lachnospiraceae bacterium]|nr:B12-binding domain-containing radical SAM protein [Lachnospiraceae bacterium]
MRVLLLAPYPDMKNIAATQYPPLGLLYIAGAIKDIVDDLKVLDANILKLSIDETVKKIRSFSPDVIGISINIVTARVAKKIAIELSKIMPKLKLVAGGPLPTLFPNDWLELFNAVIAGEGELPFRRLIEQLKNGDNIIADYHGICIKNSGHKKAIHPDLDNLPYPAYDFLEPDLYYYSKGARLVKSYMAPIMTSRGCPYNCTFCDKSVHGTNFRARSHMSVINEIQWLHDKYGIRQLDILDDNFTFDMKRAEKILDGILKIDCFAINCQNGIRADKVDEVLVKKMKQAGVFRVGIGIESGNPEILKQIKKGLKLEQVEKAIKMFRKERITTQGYFIIGFPFEKKEHIYDTISFAIKVNPHLVNFSHFFPIIGTPIYNTLQNEERLLSKKDEIQEGFFRINSHFKNSNIAHDEMAEIYRWAWRKFYFRPRKAIDILFTIKSWKEFMWMLKIAISMLKNKLLRN